MLNAQTALGYVDRIEAVRATASKDEAAILAELRSQPDYEANQDKDLLEAIRLRADARQASEDADTLIRSFDFTFDEERGETVPKRNLYQPSRA